MLKTYTCPIEVRAYELDASGHVNHGQYLHYFEHARWNLLEQENITLEDFKKWALWPIIVHADIQYLKPAFLGDKLKVNTEIIEYGKASYIFEQTLFRNDQILVRGRLKGAIMDSQGRPARIPEKMMKIWENTR